MKLFVAVILVVMCVASLSDASVLQSELPRLTFSKSVEASDIVVIGTVENLTYVVRDNILPDSETTITTDVTVRIQTLIKGEPNLGTNHVRFAVEGGKFFSASDNKFLWLEVSNAPRFKLNEVAVIFLTNDTSGIYSFYRNWPYNSLRVVLDDYGKRLIKDGAIDITYQKDNGEPKDVAIPLKVATEFGKALVANKDVAIALENQIKSLVRDSTSELKLQLPSALAARLISDSKTIVKNAKKRNLN